MSSPSKMRSFETPPSAPASGAPLSRGSVMALAGAGAILLLRRSSSNTSISKKPKKVPRRSDSPAKRAAASAAGVQTSKRKPTMGSSHKPNHTIVSTHQARRDEAISSSPKLDVSPRPTQRAVSAAMPSKIANVTKLLTIAATRKKASAKAKSAKTTASGKHASREKPRPATRKLPIGSLRTAAVAQSAVRPKIEPICSNEPQHKARPKRTRTEIVDTAMKLPFQSWIQVAKATNKPSACGTSPSGRNPIPSRTA
mmetsp:Transcript_110626/g.318036  ORF Transcript_110626/g.318036 Transcript_110626/m.318036 type:complete len:255 (+) Transcript_110626:1080-1844(+)